MKYRLIIKNLAIYLSFFSFCTTLSLRAQSYATGPQVLSFYSAVDDTEQPYAIYLPRNYDETQKYPFVVMLHGAGSNHRLALKRVFGKSNKEGETDVEASRYFPDWKDRDYIVASPFARGTMGYQGIAEQDVMDMIADVKSRFAVDENKMYLSGLSMGGGGTLWIGLSYPDMWAGIAPVCPAPPDGTEAKAANAYNFPVRFFQGGADPVVPAAGTQKWVANMKQAGIRVSYEEYPGVQHDSWVQAYEGGQIFDWFDQFIRNPNPIHVKFSTGTYQHNKAYWVQIDAFPPNTTGKLDAKFVDQNQIEIKTSNLLGFTLNLADHPKFSVRKGVFLTIDGMPVKAKAEGGKISVMKEGKRWIKGSPNAEAPFTKRKGEEGPMTAAIMDRHVYVYGTADNPSEEVLQARKAVAEKAANWSFYRGEFMGRMMVFPRVLTDKQVRPSDLEEANLILFGDKNTNAVIQQLSDELPIELNDETGELGLAYVYPRNSNYVLINAGLSIFDAPDSKKELGPWVRFSSPPILFALMKFDDYVLFDKEQVKAEGFFDNTWQLTDQAKEVLLKTGKITIK
ncbi:MAG: dienelactone hydrolase family protein [Saprospiraceae bacterium]|nr:dienelactone hydrolase family protein [Saprospiraceae bacterium]